MSAILTSVIWLINGIAHIAASIIIASAVELGWSLPVIAIILFFVLTTWNPFWFFLALPGWLFLKAKASRDLHIAEVITGWCFGAARTLNRRKWGGSTVSPLAPRTRKFGVF